MKKFFLFALLVTALFIWLNRNDSQKSTAQQEPQAATNPQAQTVSEHDWAKRSIDRARAVTQQARQNQIESQQP